MVVVVRNREVGWADRMVGRNERERVDERERRFILAGWWMRPGVLG